MSSTIALPSVLNADVAVQAQAQLRQQIQALPQGTPVVLDAAAVQSFDSAGLALLLACRRVALARGSRLQVQGWPASLRALAQVYGVMPLLDPVSAEAAVACRPLPAAAVGSPCGLRMSGSHASHLHPIHLQDLRHLPG